MRQFVFLLLLFPLPCWALYECNENGRVILNSAPCGTTFVPLLRYGVGNASHAPNSDSVTLQLDKANAYTIQGTVSGKSVTFVVDTGASSTIISSRVAGAAGLSRCVSYGTTHTANGAVANCVVISPDIVFGVFRMTDVALIVLPNMKSDVLLGMDVLKMLKLNQRGDELTISR